MAESVVGSVVSLWRYPVKSMLGEELNATAVTEKGVLGDRTFALFDKATGKVISAKHPRKWGKMFDCRAAFTHSPQPNQTFPSIKITLPDGTEAFSDSANLSEILTHAFEHEVSLISAANSQQASYEYLWPDVEGLPYQNEVTDLPIPRGVFFDAAALHLLSTASLDQLQALAPQSRFETRRFRPNLVIKPIHGETGFVENAWIEQTLEIGDEVRLQVTAPCGRCVMTTMPQAELPQDLEILRTAVKHSQGRVGVYATVLRGGTIRRGDLVRLTQTRV